MLSVGIDIAKDFHWVSVVDHSGDELVSRRVENRPGDIVGLVDELTEFGDELTVGVDVLGGIASLLVAHLQDCEIPVVHIPGIAVNRAREGTVGGANKSDPRDARVMADQVRTRRDLRTVEVVDEPTAQMRFLVGRRRAMVGDQTRKLARLHDLLSSIHPGLEAVLSLKNRADLSLLTKYVTAGELRRAGRRRLLSHLDKVPRVRRHRVERVVDEVLEVSQAQRLSIPGEEQAAVLVRAMAAELLEHIERLADLDAEIAERVKAHPDGEIVQSLPGMGPVLVSEFITQTGGIERFPSGDHLAAVAGLAPVLRQSGRSRSNRGPAGGSKDLKRVLYQSAFCSLSHPASRAFYDRKRSEGKRHHQAVIALARRRVNVLHAMLRTRQLFDPEQAIAA